MDGTLLADYLRHCRTLRDWRSEFVEQQFRGGDNDDAGNLQNLVGVEYVCGEDALAQRTRYVFPAFAGIQATSGTTTARRDLSEYRYDAALEAERRALREAVERQQNLREEATARQMQQLENELIRQQIPPPSQF